MKTNDHFAGCACCPLNRRQFINKGVAASAALLGMVATPSLLTGAQEKTRTHIRIIFSLHSEKQDRPDWPNKGFDFKPVMDRITGVLERRCKGFEFLPTTANGEEQARKILEADQVSGKVDGYIVYQMNCWNRVVQTIAGSGKPVLYADFQYGGSGGFLVYNAAFLRSNAPNVGFVASSEIKDLAEAVKCFALVKNGGTVSDFVTATAKVRQKRTLAAKTIPGNDDDLQCLSARECLKELKESKILAVRSQETGPGDEIMGIKVQHIAFSELNEAWKEADKSEAKAVADHWEKSAAKIEGVNRETLETSAAMYLAEKALLKRHDAKGITINCLGGFYGGHIHAYPCLGFHQLLNEGLVGGCECDVRSAVTMLAGTTLTKGRPGYISDPVIDTAKRQIIYAHCVAANKAFGPDGKPNPFEIVTHSEDRQGASVRSLLPVGHLTTTIECDQNKRQILLHRGVTVANDPDDRACRTKICAEPLGDMEKLFSMWDQWGWHRVTFFGDLKEPVYALADELGWKVVEEA